MTEEKKEHLFKALRYWGASFAVVAGFIYYKTNISVGVVLISGLLTLLIVVGRIWRSKESDLR